MITPAELLGVTLVPILVSAIFAAIGRRRGWRWAFPLAAGAGFIAGYALIGVPKLPPGDGNDWLFWLAIPFTALGVVDACIGRRWGWVLGGLGAGAAALVIGRPLLAGGSATPGQLAWLSTTLAVTGMLLCLASGFAEKRVGSWAVVAAWCITLSAASVIVMSSGLRILGVYGIAAATALGPVAVLIGKTGARVVAVVAVSTLAGLLAASWFYAYPGVSRLHFIVLMATPLLPIAAGWIPVGKRLWLRDVFAVLAVAIAVASITLLAAMEAKKAAESTEQDPYASEYGV